MVYAAEIPITHFSSSKKNGIEHISYTLELPADSKKHLTIYSNGLDMALHFQSDKNEWLIDVKTGKSFRPTEDFLQQFNRIDAWNPQQSVQSSGGSLELNEHLDASGCYNNNFRCTTLLDSDHVVYLDSTLKTKSSLFQSTSTEVIKITYINYRPLFSHLEEFFSGEIDFPVINSDRETLSALNYAGRFSWRERYIDALRYRINDLAKLTRLIRNLQSHPEVTKLPFIGNDSAILSQKGSLQVVQNNAVNMPREISIAACQLQASIFVEQANEKHVSSQKNNILQAIINQCSNNSMFVYAKLLSESNNQSDLAAILNKQSNLFSGMEKDDVQAYSCWLDNKYCHPRKTDGTSHHKKRSKDHIGEQDIRALNDAKLSGKKGSKETDEHQSQHRQKNGSARSSGSGMIGEGDQSVEITDKKHKLPNDGRGSFNKPNKSGDQTIPQEYSKQREWASIVQVKDKLTLLDIEETRVPLKPDENALNRLTFYAKPVDDAKSGKFMVYVSNRQQSSIPLQYGNYRIRLEIELEFQRKDYCQSSYLCVFETDKTSSFTRNNNRAVFNLSEESDWRDGHEVSFGALKPLIEDGSARYRSDLKNMRMVIKAMSIAPNI